MFSENLGREKKGKEDRIEEQGTREREHKRKESGKGKTVGNHAQKVGVE